MTKSKRSVRRWGGQLVLTCTATLATSCTAATAELVDGGDAPAAAIDPTGIWDVSYAFSESCGRPYVTTYSTLTVARTAGGYAVAADGMAAAGTVSCTPDECKLSGAFTWSAATARFQQNIEFVLDAWGDITGSGTELVVDGANSCSFTLAVRGTKR